MKYSELNLGQIEAIVNKLGGMEIVKGIHSGELFVKVLRRVFVVWKTIKIGTGFKTAEDICNTLQDANYGPHPPGKYHFTVSETEMDVDLVDVSVEDLGFEDGATRADIYKRAQELGLSLCPAEVAPQLRLQYTDQPCGEQLYIATEPVVGPGLLLNVFCVLRNTLPHSFMFAHNGRTDDVWKAGTRWVFVKPRK